MKLINNTQAKIWWLINSDGYLVIHLRHPAHWEYRTDYNCGSLLHDDGEGFTVWGVEDMVDGEFCLIPENRDEASLFEGSCFSSVNKEEETLIFIPHLKLCGPEEEARLIKLKLKEKYD